MHTVNAQIDISRPSGRRLVRELEKHPKVAKIEYPFPEHISNTGITLEEMEDRINKKLSTHYGVDFSTL